MVSEGLVVVEGDCLQRGQLFESGDDFPFYLQGVLARQFIDGGEQGCSIGDHQQCGPIAFAYDQVSLQIAESLPFGDDFGTLVNRHPVGDRSAGVLVVAPPAFSAAMAEFPVKELVVLVDALVGVLAGPDEAI